MKKRDFLSGDNISDLFYSITVHHEIDNHSAMLDEAYRVLKKGGKIAIVDWKILSETEQGPSKDIRFKTSDVKKQLTDAGFLNIIVDEKTLGNFFVVIGEKGI